MKELCASTNVLQDIVLGIQDVLIRFGDNVEWELVYDPMQKKYTITVKNPTMMP